MPSTAAGDEVHFKVKPTTKFEKIFNAWKTRKAVQTGVRFMIDGTQLHEHRTPGEGYPEGRPASELACSSSSSGLSLFSLPPPAADENMEDGDAIDAMAEQIGGRRC